MTRRSTPLLIHPDAHLIVRPSNVDNGEDPWQLEFANGSYISDEAEHQSVIVAYSQGGDSLGVEYLRWVADNLAGALGVNLLFPEEHVYVSPKGDRLKMTEEMSARYASVADYLTHSEPEDRVPNTVLKRGPYEGTFPNPYLE